MFKFSKYFFIVFLIVTVMPIAVMFAWSHYQISHDIQKREENFLEIGYKQLELSSTDLLKSKQVSIKKTLSGLPHQSMSLKQLKDLFGTREAFFFDEVKPSELSAKTGLDSDCVSKTKDVISTYSVIKKDPIKKSQIVVVSIVPINSHRKLILVDNLNWYSIFPNGPFKLKVYYGSNIQEDNLIKTVYDRFSPFVDRHERGMLNPYNKMQPPPAMHDGMNPAPIMGQVGFAPDGGDQHGQGMMPPPRKMDIPKDEVEAESPVSKNLLLKNPSGQTIAILSMKLNIHKKAFFGTEMHEIGLLILGTGVLLSLFAGFYIKKNFITPFIVLSSAVKKIKNGDLSFQIVSNARHSEIKETIKVFNSMIEGLREKDELRRSFITNLTHDLRTPLIAQERAIELIIQEFESLNLNEQLQLAKGLNKNNSHLLRMVNLILNSYRFDSENINITLNDLNLHNLVEQCYEQLKMLAAEKNISLVNNISPEFVIIKADNASMKRVLLNLIANAIDNVYNGCRVEISAVVVDNKVIIKVEDNGTGIAPADLGHIFDRYYTGKSDERKLGSGLGLYVCKKLVELHKGEIKVESEVNKYTRFFIILPL